MTWQRTYRYPWIRQQEIAWAATQLILGTWWDQWRGFDPARSRQRRAKWLVNRLVELGPTFIRLGQAVSSRVDLLPLEYIQDLKTLPGWMPPMSTEAAIACIEAEFGASVYLLYRTFDPMPIAADSLGQVHRATLPTGESVVVKIQRPELEQLFRLDLAILRQLVPFIQRCVGWNSPCNLEKLFEELAQRLHEDLNWIQTGLNADRLRHNFRGAPVVWVPKIYPDYTTRHILTMEYAPGATITDHLRLEASGVDVTAMQELVFYCYLKQVLQDGFFQTYLNSSKLAISQNNRLILYGFSDVAELSPLKRSQLIQALSKLRQQDGDAVIHTLVNGGLLEPDMPPILMRQAIQMILQYLNQDLIDRQSFSQMQAEIYGLFRQRPFCLPSHTLWILQGLICLDGIAQSLNPTYNLRKAAQPILANPSIYQRLILKITSLGSLLVRQKS